MLSEWVELRLLSEACHTGFLMSVDVCERGHVCRGCSSPTRAAEGTHVWGLPISESIDLLNLVVKTLRHSLLHQSRC